MGYQNKFSKFHSFAYLDLRAVMLFNEEINETSWMDNSLSHEADKSIDANSDLAPIEVESPQLNRMLSVDSQIRDLENFTEAYEAFNMPAAEPERP